MDVLALLFGVAGIAFSLWVIYWALKFVWEGTRAVSSGCFPVIIGVVVCVALFRSGHDNLGVLAAIIGLIGNHFWFDRITRSSGTGSGRSHDWRDDKKKRYDTEGRIIGYEDRD